MTNTIHTTYTSIKTIKKVYSLLNQIGLDSLLSGDAQVTKQISIGGVVKSLLLQGKLVEFMTIITKDNTTDWEQLEAQELGQTIENFFSRIMNIIPGLSDFKQLITVKVQETMKS